MRIRLPRSSASGLRCLGLTVALFAGSDRANATPGDPANGKPCDIPPVMDQQAIDWLNSEGSASFGRWLTAQLAADPDHPEWLDMLSLIHI